jgi:hypothetical protein
MTTSSISGVSALAEAGACCAWAAVLKIPAMAKAISVLGTAEEVCLEIEFEGVISATAN